MNFIESLGYLAIVFIVIAFTFQDIKRIRIWNAVGSSTFALYGLLKGAYPVMIGNGIIAAINIVQIWRIYKPLLSKSKKSEIQ